MRCLVILLTVTCTMYALQHPGVTVQFLVNANDPIISMCT